MSFRNQPTHPFHEQDAIVVVLLTLVTFGFYQHYWHYRSWKTIQRVSGDTTFSPLLRGLLFPFFIISLVAVVRGSADIHGVSRGIARTSFAVIYTVVAFFGGGTETLYALILAAVAAFLLYLLQTKTAQINRVSQERDTPHKEQAGSASHNFPSSTRAPEIVRADYRHLYFKLPHRLTIELSTFVVVLMTCLAVAFNDAEKFIAKVRLLDVLAFSSNARTDVAEIYGLTGNWPETDLDYLLDNVGSPIIRDISSYANGIIHFRLTDTPPFSEDDALTFSPQAPEQRGPIRIHRWQCKAEPAADKSRPSDINNYLPSICRG